MQKLLLTKELILPFFNKGAEEDEHFWHAVFRQIVVQGLIKKVESYGTLSVTEKGDDYNCLTT